MSWRDIGSQPLVCNLLNRSLEHRRIHHGYLFAGEESETEMIALAFAQSLNCEKNDGDFCGQCSSCKMIAKNQHPDIYIVCPGSQSRRILISQIRELEKSIFLRASSARIKVVIIRAVDRLQPEAQDAFLKTLEEPPSKTVFLLLTEEPQQLKETILSRCLRVPFRPASKKGKTEHEQQIEEWLKEFTQPISSSDSTILRAYGFTGKVLGLLKEVREQKIKEGKQLLDDPSLEHLETSQRERLEQQMEARAQANYLHERNNFLKTILEWYHTQHFHISAVQILETLARQLSRNINESLVWEIAILELAEVRRV